GQPLVQPVLEASGPCMLIARHAGVERCRRADRQDTKHPFRLFESNVRTAKTLMVDMDPAEIITAAHERVTESSMAVIERWHRTRHRAAMALSVANRGLTKANHERQHHDRRR